MKLKLGAKFISFITIILLLSGLVLFLFTQSRFVKSLEEDKKVELQELVRIAVTVVDSYYKKELTGELTREDAQTRAYTLLRGMLYGDEGQDYYYINDSNGYCIMNAKSKSIEGKYLLDIKDQDGLLLFKEMDTIAKNQGAGFVRYKWSYYGDENRIEDKLAYIEMFDGWGWIIGTGIYINDIDEKLRVLGTTQALVTLVIVALGIILSIIFSRTITNPILSAVNFADLIEKKDLSQNVDEKLIKKADETGMLAKSLNNMKNSFSDIIKDITNGVLALSESSTELSNISENMNVAVTDTNQRTNSVATSIEEMNVNMNNSAAGIEQTSTNLNSIASASTQMNATINEISKNTEKAKDITDSAVGLTKKVSGNINNLGDSAKAIGDVTETISNISSQTNLLALNATIEAARAGAAGKGFAVVAGEIKDLAHQTATATEDIKNRILGIQEAVNLSIDDIKSVSDVVTQVNQIVNSIAAAIEEQSITTRDISNNINEASTGVSETSRLVSESASVTTDIASNISRVAESTNDVSDQADNIVSSISELNKLAEKLESIVNLFNLG